MCIRDNAQNTAKHSCVSFGSKQVWSLGTLKKCPFILMVTTSLLYTILAKKSFIRTLCFWDKPAVDVYSYKNTKNACAVRFLSFSNTMTLELSITLGLKYYH